MKIKNLAICGVDAIRYLNSDIIKSLSKSLEFISKLFRFNGNVSLEFVSNNYILSNFPSIRYIYPNAEAITFQDRIYVSLDNICTDNVFNVVIHEYVHVCKQQLFQRFVQCGLMRDLRYTFLIKRMILLRYLQTTLSAFTCQTSRMQIFTICQFML